MIKQVLCSPLSPKAISFEDTSYSLRPSCDVTPDIQLQKSIKTLGILQPPLLLQKNSKHLILSGRKRLEIAQQLDIKEIPCFTLNETTEEFTVFQLLLTHALIGSQLSIIEQSFFFQKASKILPEEQTLALMPLLGIQANRYKLEELQAYLLLEEATVHALHSGKIQPKTGIKLRNLPGEDQETLVEIICYFQLGGSKQQKLIDLANTLSRRKKCSITSVLGDIMHADANRPQRAAKLLRDLEEQCNPISRQAEKQFQQFANTLHMPENFTLQHTPFFEDDQLTLSIVLDNKDGLQTLIQQITSTQ